MSDGYKRLTGIQLAAQARDLLPKALVDIKEILGNSELSLREQVVACFEILPRGVNMFKFWPHTEQGRTFEGAVADLKNMSVIVLAKTYDEKHDRERAMLRVVGFVYDPESKHLHIGEASWTKRVAELGLADAGNNFDFYQQDKKARDYIDGVDNPKEVGLCEAAIDLFQRLSDNEIPTLDSAKQADLPMLEIPVSFNSPMELWSQSRAFKSHLAATVQTQGWVVDGIDGLAAPGYGTVRVTTNGVEFKGSKGIRLFSPGIVQEELAAMIKKVFNPQDFVLQVKPKFPVGGREFAVQDGESLFVPSNLPVETNGMRFNQDELLTRLQHVSDNDFESGRVYRGFSYWAALTKLRTVENGSYLDGRFVSGTAKPRIRLHDSQLVGMTYGLGFTLDSAASQFEGGRRLTPEEVQRREARRHDEELVLIDLNNKQLREGAIALGEARRDLERRGVLLDNGRGRPAANKGKPVQGRVINLVKPAGEAHRQAEAAKLMLSVEPSVPSQLSEAERQVEAARVMAAAENGQIEVPKSVVEAAPELTVANPPELKNPVEVSLEPAAEVAAV